MPRPKCQAEAYGRLDDDTITIYGEAVIPNAKAFGIFFMLLDL